MLNVKQEMLFLCLVVFDSSCWCSLEESKGDAERDLSFLMFFREQEKAVCLC